MWRGYGFVGGALAAITLLAPPASAQVTNGRIHGRVTDVMGTALPGVTVTLESEALFHPMVDVTTISGRYEFPVVPIGRYTVSFELSDFKTVVRSGVVIDTAFQAEVNARLEAGGPGQTVTIAGAAPIVDTRRTSTGATLTREVMDRIPTPRDPWQIVNMAAGVQTSDLNVGGNLSGQQVTFLSRGQGRTATTWNVEGATITDMAAEGTSPSYYDFGSIQQIHVTTGAADASVQTSGLNINLVTRSGSNLFRGSARGVYSDDHLQWQNVTEELFDQGAGSGAPIRYFREYGVEAGGPIARRRAWWWLAGARQDINASVLGFYDTSRPGCDPPPAGFENFEAHQDCLQDDLTFIYNYTGKLNYQPNAPNRFQALYMYANKTRNARGASPDLAPESAYRQTSAGPGAINVKHTGAVTGSLVLDSLAHYTDGGFNLLPQIGTEDEQRLVIRETGFTSRGLYTLARRFIRPTTEVKTDGSYFIANQVGGAHSVRFGLRYRNTPWQSDTFWPGGAEARLSTRYVVGNPNYGSVNPDGPLGPDRAQLYRPGSPSFGLWTAGAYVQDGYTRGRLRLNLGVRWDYQDDEARAGCVDANPILPEYLPAQCFEGEDADISFSDISPRVSATYDLFGTGRTILKGGYGRYYGQGVGLASALSLLGGVTLEFQNTVSRTCWNDANGDTVVQREELNLTGSCLAYSANYDSLRALEIPTSNAIDSDLKNDRTREFTAGIEHELLPNLAVGVHYVHRIYDQLRSSSTRIGETKDIWIAREWTDADALAAGVAPPSSFGLPGDGWIYYEVKPNVERALYWITRNTDETRVYDGLDLVATKRLSDRWMLNAAVTLQQRVDDPNFCHDCTNNDTVEGLNNQTAYIVKLNGAYELPREITVSAHLQIEQGENRTIQFDGPPFGYRPGGRYPSGFFTQPLGAARFTAFAFGEMREPRVHLLDAQITKDIALRGGRNRLSLVFSVFNVLNANTARGFQDDLNVSTFGNVTSILSPRVARIQASITF